MFEDSTFDSTRRIRTRSRGWMIAAFAIEASVLLAFILIPLIFPEALPRQFAIFLVDAPTPPPAQPPRTQPIAQTVSTLSQTPSDPFAAPPKIPRGIVIPASPDPAPFTSIGDLAPGVGTPGGTGNPLLAQMTPRVVIHPDVKTTVRVPSSAEEALLIRKTIPVYPRIGLAAHAEGTVILAATISKAGSIENLRVVSGPPLLQRAALDAVSTWRYRPYLLDNQPVEVETTVNVIFALTR
jgi:protein TonB